MSKSIGSNFKTVATNSVAIPMGVAGVTLEVAGDLSDITVGAIGGVLPTTKALGNMMGLFITGMMNSEMDEEKAKMLYEETTLADVVNTLEASSLKAGQDLVKSWNSENK